MEKVRSLLLEDRIKEICAFIKANPNGSYDHLKEFPLDIDRMLIKDSLEIFECIHQNCSNSLFQNALLSRISKYMDILEGINKSGSEEYEKQKEIYDYFVSRNLIHYRFRLAIVLSNYMTGNSLFNILLRLDKCWNFHKSSDQFLKLKPSYDLFREKILKNRNTNTLDEFCDFLRGDSDFYQTN